MSETSRVRRLWAIVIADVRTRFRRPSTLIIFFVLSGLAYAVVPDPATGNALLIVGQRRAVNNAAAMGLATAMLATLFFGMAGFYVVSNAIARDVRSRCGFVIASTTMTSAEYLVAKLAGNIVFLATFTAGFMISSMAMLLVRNETALELWPFVAPYLLITPSTIVLVGVLALVFESVRGLSGRMGDVLYFFLFLAWFGAPLLIQMQTGSTGPSVGAYIDFAGLAFVHSQMTPLMDSPTLSIGGPFDPSNGVIVLPGLALPPAWVLPRLVSTLAPLPLLFVARLAFHRFDPARVKDIAAHGGTGWMARTNLATKPLTRVLGAFASAVASDRTGSSVPSLVRAAQHDARLTLTAMPVLVIVAAALAIATLVTPADGFKLGVLPVGCLAAGLAIADVACRERRAGTLGLIYAMPLLKAHFVGWKLMTSVLVMLALLGVPLVRVAVAHPTMLVPFLVGLFLIAAVATALGLIGGTPKTFTVVFLTFFYVVMNTRGGAASAPLDFAGFYGTATPRVTLAYALVGAACLGVAWIIYLMRERPESRIYSGRSFL